MDGERPHVLIVGGFLTSPPLYRGMRRALERRETASVAVAPIWLPDWLLVPAVGLGPLMRRTAAAVAGRYRAVGRRPLLVIGHSAGGVLARLAMSPEPYERRRAGVGEAVAALVTLGTPHHLVEPSGRRSRVAYAAATYLEATTPGAWFAPRTGYVTVGSRYAEGAATTDPDRRRRTIGRVYAELAGAAARTGWGDGLIPEAAFHLDGARRLTLEGVIHGQSLGARWYGSEEIVDEWWPVAVETWRSALHARAVASTPATQPDAG
jgi:hypothetical protein